MNIRKLLCAVCVLSGCTLSLTEGLPEDEHDHEYDVYDDGPATRPWRPVRETASSATAGGGSIAPSFVPSDVEPDPAAVPLRDLTLHMTGMHDEVRRFMKVRIASREGQTVAVGILHEGIPTADYTFEMPAVLRDDTAYTLTFYADTDESGGYSAPPADHAWSLPIPAGREDVRIDFDHHEGYVDIERDAPRAAQGLVVTFHDMQEYYEHPLDVRVTERASGRLVGRHVGPVPGNGFDLAIGGVIHDGLEYQIDVAVDIDQDGFYDRIIDDSWRVNGLANRKGLAISFVPNGPYVDVGF